MIRGEGGGGSMFSIFREVNVAFFGDRQRVIFRGVSVFYWISSGYWFVWQPWGFLGNRGILTEHGPRLNLQNWRFGRERCRLIAARGGEEDNMMGIDTRRIRRAILFVPLVVTAGSLGAIGTARADDLVLKCVKNDRNPVFGNIDFTAWIDLSNSRVIIASGELIYDGTAIVNATTIHITFGNSYNPVNVYIDRKTGGARYSIDVDVANQVCNRSSAPRPALKF